MPDDFVPKGVCDERHKSLKQIREEIIKKNDSEHEAMDEKFTAINVSIQNLSTATTTSFNRVHDRIDTLNTTIIDRFTEISEGFSDKCTEMKEDVSSKITKMNDGVNIKFTDLTKCIFSIQDNIKNKVIWMLVGIIGSLVIAIGSIAWQIIKPEKAHQDFTKIEHSLDMVDKKLERNKNVADDINQRLDNVSKRIDQYHKRDAK